MKGYKKFKRKEGTEFQKKNPTMANLVFFMLMLKIRWMHVGNNI